MQVDLPAFERPTKAISGTSRAGKKCSCGAVVKNFAVCSQPMATLAAGLFALVFTGAEPFAATPEVLGAGPVVGSELVDWLIKLEVRPEAPL